MSESDTPQMVFITGDRSMNPAVGIIPVYVLITTLLEAAMESGAKIRFVTGDNDGVEAIMRWTAVECGVIGTPLDADGKPDWQARADQLATIGFERVYVFHGEPENSKMLKPMLVPEWDDRLMLIC